MNEFVKKIRDFLDARGILHPHNRVAVAWSGGGDSTFLMWALRELECAGLIRCMGLHVNHGIRESSAREEEQVQILSKKLGIDLEVIRLSLSSGPGMQARAREARYSGMERAALRRKCVGILTGHSFDDQAETIVMRIMRGAQLRGLRGILPQTDRGWFRPMLEISHKEAVDTLKKLEIPFVSDPSNTDPRFLRVRVRKKLLPQLELHEPTVRERLVQISRDAWSLWSENASQLEKIEPSVALSIHTLIHMPSFLRGAALEKWLGHRLESKHIEKILKLTQAVDNSRQSAPGAHTIHRVGDYLVAGPRSGSPDLETAFASIILLGRSVLQCPAPLGSPKSAQWLPAHLLPPSPKKSRRLVKEALRKKKVSPILRPLWPVLVDKAHVLGIAGIDATPIPTKMGCRQYFFPKEVHCFTRWG